MQVLNIFSDGQNCQNQTFKWLYQLNESKYEKSFFEKTLTAMLFHMYQVFSSLLGLLYFSLHFFSTFMEQLFLNHPIFLQSSAGPAELKDLIGFCGDIFRDFLAECPVRYRLYKNRDGWWGKCPCTCVCTWISLYEKVSLEIELDSNVHNLCNERKPWG